MWNPNKGYQDESSSIDDESWEVEAFEQDIKGNIAGSTWPPRSYTCNFCRREFRSAQALGGHMNVHRRDRAAHLHGRPVARGAAVGTVLNLPSSSSSCVAPFSKILIQPTANNIEGLCHFYQSPNPSGIFSNSADLNMCDTIDASPSYSNSLIPSMPPNLSCNFPFPLFSFAADNAPKVEESHHRCSPTAKNLASIDHNTGNATFDLNGQSKLKDINTSEEPDLELRLGLKAAAQPP